MTNFARSLVVLLIAVFLASTLVVTTHVPSANASVAIAAMPMAASTPDCKTCGPHSDMAALCDLTCALSMVAVMHGPAIPVSASSDCRFDFADATASGQAPPPAFTPPRTTALV